MIPVRILVFLIVAMAVTSFGCASTNISEYAKEQPDMKCLEHVKTQDTDVSGDIKYDKSPAVVLSSKICEPSGIMAKLVNENKDVIVEIQYVLFSSSEYRTQGYRTPTVYGNSNASGYLAAASLFIDALGEPTTKRTTERERFLIKGDVIINGGKYKIETYLDRGSMSRMETLTKAMDSFVLQANFNMRNY